MLSQLHVEQFNKKGNVMVYSTATTGQDIQAISLNQATS
jgi:hypothetical protein